ncbi:hypothetical protein CTI14_59910, partial [Methylobacterium radiotolerans]
DPQHPQTRKEPTVMTATASLAGMDTAAGTHSSPDPADLISFDSLLSTEEHVRPVEEPPPHLLHALTPSDPQHPQTRKEPTVMTATASLAGMDTAAGTHSSP